LNNLQVLVFSQHKRASHHHVIVTFT
jgi:hypothetical protein